MAELDIEAFRDIETARRRLMAHEYVSAECRELQREVETLLVEEEAELLPRGESIPASGGHGGTIVF